MGDDKPIRREARVSLLRDIGHLNEALKCGLADGAKAAEESWHAGFAEGARVTERNLRDEVAKLRAENAKLRKPDREVRYVRGSAVGEWTRIGRYDSAGRRSLWIRLVGEEDDDGCPEAIELCSGREGDDAFVRIDRENPRWAALSDVLTRVAWDCGVKADGETAKP